MKIWMAVVLLAVICCGVYAPARNAEFVLDDYYTIVRDPLIKNPSLYQNIWTSRLFDAHQSSSYIKFGYYRPVLQSSWILDYRLFGLKATGYKWMNLLIHMLNCVLLYILFWKLFGQEQLALKASLLFCVLPTQEWVVRYVTGRGDELSALFALVALFCLIRQRYLLVMIFWVLSALTREVALSYILYALLIHYFSSGDGKIRDEDTDRFCFFWVLIGILPLLLICPIIPKLGNILALHILYFASAGICLWLARLRLGWTAVLFVLFISVSFYQGRFWTSEQSLLRHVRSLEFWPRTVAAQQLLMKYDEDVPAVVDLAHRAHDPVIKAMWLRRLGVVYFNHNDLSRAQQYFIQALSIKPEDVDILNALAVVYHQQGEEALSLKCLDRALEINPDYPDTLRTLGIYYYLHKNYPLARVFLSRCLIFDPDNAQARDLLALANKMF